MRAISISIYFLIVMLVTVAVAVGVILQVTEWPLSGESWILSLATGCLFGAGIAGVALWTRTIGAPPLVSMGGFAIAELIFALVLYYKLASWAAV